MIAFLMLLIGLLLGFISRGKIIDLVNSLKLPKKNTYFVKFHVYFTVHQSGRKLNDLIKTESLQITVTARNKDEVLEFVNEMINNEARIEIESLEQWT